MSMIRTLARRAALETVGPAVVAAAISVLAALALRYVLAVPMPAELFADQATTRIPLPIFETMLITFGTAAKHLYLIGALVAEAALAALGGILYVLARRAFFMRRGASERIAETFGYADMIVLALAQIVVSCALLAPVFGAGFFGSDVVGGAPTFILAQLAPDIVFAVSFGMQLRAAARLQSRENGGEWTAVSRRTLLRQSVTAAVTLGGGIALWQALTSGLGALVGASPARSTAPSISLNDIPQRITPPPVPVYGPYTAVKGQAPELTSPSDFYYVSKNLAGDPMVQANGWTLSVDGMVNRPYTLTYDQLKALPQVTQYHTLECISNEVGGVLMSNGYFTGVKLADVLNTAGIQQGASEMIFTAADGYSDSLHLSQAIDDRSLIVYLLDGEPLPIPHGFPARLLIPGLYGMKNGKWLTKLSLASGQYNGYWEQRGWTHEAFVKLSSRIDTPLDGDLLTARPTMIAGVAYSGAKGISRVDVSLDGGHSWSAANLKRPLGALTWTLWEQPWTPSSGQHIIVVRAVDLEGNVQRPQQAAPLPDGSSGYHAITVTTQ